MLKTLSSIVTIFLIAVIFFSSLKISGQENRAAQVSLRTYLNQIEKMITVALGLDPLWENCLGKDWKTIMTRDKAKSLFLKM